MKWKPLRVLCAAISGMLLLYGCTTSARMPQTSMTKRIAPLRASSGPTARPHASALREDALSAERSGAPLDVAEVVAIALANNPDVEAVRQRLAGARAALDAARAQFWPRVDLIQRYHVSNSPVQSFMFQLHQAEFDMNQNFNEPGTNDDWHTQIALRHDVYTGGRRTARTQAAAQRRESRRDQEIAVRSELTFRSAQAFYQLLQARDVVQIREEALRRVRQHRDTVQTRLEAGTAVKSDVLQLDVRLAEAREALVSARTHLALAWDMLENLAAQPLRDRGLPAKIPDMPWQRHAQALEASVAQALAERPEVHALERRVDAAEHSVRAARAGYLPHLSVVANYDLHSRDFTAQDESFFVGVMLKIPLFDGWQTRAAVRESRALQRELVAQLRRERLNVALDVRRAYRGVKDARARVAVTQQAIEQAAESLREIEQRYASETATITELIDARVQHTMARGRHTVATADIRIAQCRLLWAVGALAQGAADLPQEERR